LAVRKRGRDFAGAPGAVVVREIGQMFNAKHAWFLLFGGLLHKWLRETAIDSMAGDWFRLLLARVICQHGRRPLYQRPV